MLNGIEVGEAGSELMEKSEEVGRCSCAGLEGRRGAVGESATPIVEVVRLGRSKGTANVSLLPDF